MKSNIVIISFFNNFKKKFAKVLADELQLYYVDVAEFMEFNLIDLEDVLKTCGSEYLNNLEKKTIKDVSEFENTVITLENNQLFEKENITNLKKTSVLIYLKIPNNLEDKTIQSSNAEVDKSTDAVEKLIFEERENNIIENSEIIVELSSLNVDNALKKVIKAISLHYN